MSENRPTVSVVMPCYNQGAYIDEAVDSVWAQTYRPLELVIVDDGSTEPLTQERLRYCEQLGLQVFHTENRGPSSARNTGIQKASGDYIFPLDADDRIAPTYIEQAVCLMQEHPNVGIVYAKADYFGDRNGVFELPNYQFPEILLGNMIVNSALFRKSDWEKVGGYNTNMVYGWEDYDFWLSIIELGREVIRIPEVLYFHRELAVSRTAKMTQQHWVHSYVQIFHNHSQLYLDHLDVLFQHLIHVRDDAYQAHTRLHDALTSVEYLKQEAIALRTELHATQAKLADMEKSRFWQLRNHWFRLKARLGFSSDA